MALPWSRMATEQRRSSDGVLEWDVSESELVGMDDRLEEEGNWFLMFPVSSLIWSGTKGNCGLGSALVCSVPVCSVMFCYVR